MCSILLRLSAPEWLRSRVFFKVGEQRTAGGHRRVPLARQRLARGHLTPGAVARQQHRQMGGWPTLGHARGAGGAAVVGDKIIVVGGRTGNPEQLVTQTEVYDGTSWRDAGDIPVPGDHLAVAADSSYLYAVGGRKFSASSNTDVVQCYDPKANRWTALTPTPQPVGGAGAAIVNGQLIVVGGETPTSVSGTVQAYDVSAPNATWTTLASLDPGRHGLGVTAIGNTLYAVGGATKAGDTASTKLVGALAFS